MPTHSRVEFVIKFHFMHGCHHPLACGSLSKDEAILVTTIFVVLLLCSVCLCVRCKKSKTIIVEECDVGASTGEGKEGQAGTSANENNTKTTNGRRFTNLSTTLATTFHNCFSLL